MRRTLNAELFPEIADRLDRLIETYHLRAPDLEETATGVSEVSGATASSAGSVAQSLVSGVTTTTGFSGDTESNASRTGSESTVTYGEWPRG